MANQTANSKYRMLAQIGWAARDAAGIPRSAQTANARAAFSATFATPEDSLLSPGEAAHRVQARRRAHYLRLALRSAQVRATRRRLAAQPRRGPKS